MVSIMMSFVVLLIISWDTLFFYLCLNFMLAIMTFGGNMFLFFEKSMLSNLMVLLSIYVIMLAVVQSSGGFYSENKISTKFYVNILCLMLILFVCFYSTNFFFFYFMFELAVVPIFIIILGWGYSSERIQAGVYLIMYTLFASLPFLIFLLNLYLTISTMMMDLGGFMVVLFNTKFWWIMSSFVFMVKMPIFIVHIWLPKAHVEAPVSGSMILAGILLKLGSYGFLKSFSICIMSFIGNTYILYSISLVGTIIISLNCLRQSDLKCLVAYSSISHMNLMMVGLLNFSWIGIKGSVIMMIAHGLSSISMFFILNIFYKNLKTRSSILVKNSLFYSPILFMWWFLFCCLNMSFPPSINFISEVFLLISIYSNSLNSIMFLIFILMLSGFYSIILFTSTSHGMSMPKFFMSITLNENLILLLNGVISFLLSLLIFIL